jgi:hypothetical protein
MRLGSPWLMLVVLGPAACDRNPPRREKTPAGPVGGAGPHAARPDREQRRRGGRADLGHGWLRGAPRGRTAVDAFDRAIGSRIYVAAGRGRGRNLDTFEIYDVAADAWSAVGRSPASRLAGRTSGSSPEPLVAGPGLDGPDGGEGGQDPDRESSQG